MPTVDERFHQAITASQDAFQEHLLSMTKEDILYHVFECAVRNDIAMAAEDSDLNTDQKLALLQSPDFINDVYKDFCKVETDYMPMLRQILSERANFCFTKMSQD